MAAIVKAIDQNGDLMRMAIATPGNDFRLGACEAPPSIISTYLGESVTEYLQAYINGESKAYVPKTKFLSMGTSVLAPIEVSQSMIEKTPSYSLQIPFHSYSTYYHSIYYHPFSSLLSNRFPPRIVTVPHPSLTAVTDSNSVPSVPLK